MQRTVRCHAQWHVLQRCPPRRARSCNDPQAHAEVYTTQHLSLLSCRRQPAVRMERAGRCAVDRCVGQLADGRAAGVMVLPVAAPGATLCQAIRKEFLVSAAWEQAQFLRIRLTVSHGGQDFCQLSFYVSTASFPFLRLLAALRQSCLVGAMPLTHVAGRPPNPGLCIVQISVS